MTEHEDRGKVVAIKLTPVGSHEIAYELVYEKKTRLEVGPNFGCSSENSAKGQIVEVENISEGVKWFRENGGV